MTPDIPDHFTPDQRTAIRRFDLAAAWSASCVEGLRVRGDAITSRKRLIDTLRDIDGDELRQLNEDLRMRCERANDEREAFESHAAYCRGCLACDPAGEAARQAQAESARVAKFRASPAGQNERIIELLVSIDRRLAGGGA